MLILCLSKKYKSIASLLKLIKMGVFKKKSSGGGFFIDLRRFAKKKPEETSAQASSVQPASAVAETTAPFFIGELAGIGATNESSSANAGSNYSGSAFNSSASGLDVHDKIDILTNRMHKLLERIELLELKLNKIERKDSLY